MDKIILGLLMIKDLTTYELRSIIEMNFTSMCSNSLGSIQAALKKLHEKNMVVYHELIEKGVNKKVYTLTPEGETCFLSWIQTSMVGGKTKDMELSKLFFMGFVPAQKRRSLVDSYLADLRKEKDQLENIKVGNSETIKSEYIAYLEENKIRLDRFLRNTDSSTTQTAVQEIIDFELLTLQFGIDRINFEIQWFEHLKEKLVVEME